VTAATRVGVIESVDCEVYEIPTDRPEADGTLAWSATTMVLVALRAGGCEGIGWTYAGAGCRAVVEHQLTGVLRGGDPMDIPRLSQGMIRACRNLGRPGLVSCAISAVDIALWDLKARLLGVALSTLVGRFHDSVAVYGSGGFTTYDAATTRAQLGHWVHELGVRRVKIKIAESWGTEEPRDLARVALAREAVGPDVEVYVDANGGYTRKQAVRIGRALTQAGVTWFEEPVSSDDLAGLREVRDQVQADVAAGEYGYDLSYFARMVAAQAVDCLQVDVTRCGGITEFLRVAAVAAAHNLQVSAHCAPNLHASVAVGVPNLRHLEYFHDHARIEDMLFDGALSPQAGRLCPDPDRPGLGLSLKTVDAEKFRVA